MMEIARFEKSKTQILTGITEVFTVPVQFIEQVLTHVSSREETHVFGDCHCRMVLAPLRALESLHLIITAKHYNYIIIT